MITANGIRQMAIMGMAREIEALEAQIAAYAAAGDQEMADRAREDLALYEDEIERMMDEADAVTRAA